MIPENWETAIGTVAESVLNVAGVDRPPVDAFGIATRLRFTVLVDHAQTSRGRYKRLDGKSVIVLKPEEREERLQWSCAHELGEAHAWKIFNLVSDEEMKSSEGVREQVANLFASRLLLPSKWFFDDASRLHYDLCELKKIYVTASHELIALRFLDSSEETIVTVFDHGRVTRRHSNRMQHAVRLIPLERNCQQEVHRINKTLEIQERGLRVQCWPVHEPGWKREIIRTTLDERE